MRGQRLFNDLVNPNPSVNTPKRKGRSAQLVSQRNNLLYHRYYYYLRVHRLRYEDVLSCLEHEFCISKLTIAEIIADNALAVSSICKTQPSVAILSKHFPHFNWNVKTI